MTYNAHVIILYISYVSFFATSTTHRRRTMGLICWLSWTPPPLPEWTIAICIFRCCSTLWLRLAASATSTIQPHLLCDNRRRGRGSFQWIPFVFFIRFLFLSFIWLQPQHRQGNQRKCIERARQAMETKPFYVQKNLHWLNVNGANIIVCAIYGITGCF